MFVPGKSPDKVKSNILGVFFLGELHIVYMDRGGGHVSLRVTWIDLGRFAFSVKQWLDHCPWLVLQCRRQRLLRKILERLACLQCIVGIIMALGHCLGERLH
jgi:hypothetical protein